MMLEDLRALPVDHKKKIFVCVMLAAVAGEVVYRSLKEIYDWTDHKHTPWAKKAGEAIAQFDEASK